MRYAVAAGFVAGRCSPSPASRQRGRPTTTAGLQAGAESRSTSGRPSPRRADSSISPASGAPRARSVRTAHRLTFKRRSTARPGPSLCEDPARRLRSPVQRATSPAAVPSSPATTSCAEPTAGLHVALGTLGPRQAASTHPARTRRFGRTPIARRMPHGCQSHNRDTQRRAAIARRLAATSADRTDLHQPQRLQLIAAQYSAREDCRITTGRPGYKSARAGRRRAVVLGGRRMDVRGASEGVRGGDDSLRSTVDRGLAHRPTPVAGDRASGDVQSTQSRRKARQSGPFLAVGAVGFEPT